MASKQKPKKQYSLGPFYLMAAGLLIVTGVLIWQAVAATPAASPSNALGSTSLNDLPYPSIERISIVDAKLAFDNNEAVFVDVRDSSSYQTGHIPGSVNIALTEFDALYPKLSKDDWIILYCT